VGPISLDSIQKGENPRSPELNNAINEILFSTVFNGCTDGQFRLRTMEIFVDIHILGKPVNFRRVLTPYCARLRRQRSPKHFHAATGGLPFSKVQHHRLQLSVEEFSKVRYPHSRLTNECNLVCVAIALR